VSERTENPELEKQILDAPDDEQRYLAYGAWLREQGDPRGELCAIQAFLLDAQRAHESRLAQSEGLEWAVQLATALGMSLLNVAALLDGGPLYKRLRKWDDDVFVRGRLRDAEALLEAHHAAWLQGLERELAREQIWPRPWYWQLGFLRESTIQERNTRVAAQVVEQLSRHPEARFLRRLHFEAPVDQRLISALALHAPRTLRMLGFRIGNDARKPCTLAPLCAMLPELESLGIGVERGELELGAIKLPQLRKFYFEAWMSQAHARALTSAQWPKLQMLSLTFDAAEPHGDWPLLPALARPNPAAGALSDGARARQAGPLAPLLARSTSGRARRRPAPLPPGGSGAALRRRGGARLVVADPRRSAVRGPAARGAGGLAAAPAAGGARSPRQPAERRRRARAASACPGVRAPALAQPNGQSLLTGREGRAPQRAAPGPGR
jgi:uncharacterized protein (TIGR02996 family)